MAPRASALFARPLVGYGTGTKKAPGALRGPTGTSAHAGGAARPARAQLRAMVSAAARSMPTADKAVRDRSALLEAALQSPRGPWASSHQLKRMLSTRVSSATAEVLARRQASTATRVGSVTAVAQLQQRRALATDSTPTQKLATPTAAAPAAGSEPAPSNHYQTSLALHEHLAPATLVDHLALGTVKFLRIFADAFFQKRYIHRACMLETVAAVPGMVAGMLRHLRSLRRMKHDGGYISKLLEEAENERMHLMTFMKMAKPSFWERMLVIAVQGAFFNAYFVAYLVSPRLCHRIVGYLEEEAVVSYTQFLKEIDDGHIENTADIPDFARKYWNLPAEARLRDLVIQVRADETVHRHVNHDIAHKVQQHYVDSLGNPIL